jgi:hypothetical protein
MSMQGTGAGWDSCLYRAFIVCGLAAVIAAVVVSVMLTPDSSQIPVQVGVGGMALFMALLVGYWAYQIIYKGYGSPKVVDDGKPADVHDLSVLGSWSTLFGAMVTHGGNPEELKAMEKQGRSSLGIWFGWSAVIALGPLILMIPYLLGWMHWSYIRYGVIAYLGLVVMMILFTGPLLRRASQANEAIYLAPLGLKQTALPQIGLIPGVDGPRPAVRGASVIEGVRFGRPVRIELNRWQVSTLIQARSKGFVIHSRAGKLEAAQGAPQAVTHALAGLRKAKRWATLEMRGEPTGIRAARNGRGLNMWLYDLWLIERILGEMENERKT